MCKVEETAPELKTVSFHTDETQEEVQYLKFKMLPYSGRNRPCLLGSVLFAEDTFSFMP